MFATRRALLWTFAGGCVSGALFILSVVGGVSLWRDFETNRPERTLDRGAPAVVATSTPVSERAADDDAATLAVEPPRAPAVPRTTDEHASSDVAPPKDAQDTDGTNESGASVADVLVRLEKAYRQGLAPTTPAVASSNIAPEPTSTAAGTAAPASTVANATPVPTTIAVVEPAPSPAREPSVTVSVIVQNPPAPAPPPEPAVAAPAEAPPAAVAQNEALAPSGVAAAAPAAPTNINIENLHQGDVYNYNVQQQLVQQYMQVLGGSPYGYPGYTGYPVAAPAGSRHYAYYGPQRFSNLPALPVSAPPFPSYIGSVTNPDNPNGVHSRALRFR